MCHCPKEGPEQRTWHGPASAVQTDSSDRLLALHLLWDAVNRKVETFCVNYIKAVQLSHSKLSLTTVLNPSPFSSDLCIHNGGYCTGEMTEVHILKGLNSGRAANRATLKWGLYNVCLVHVSHNATLTSQMQQDWNNCSIICLFPSRYQKVHNCTKSCHLCKYVFNFVLLFITSLEPKG